MPGRLQQKAVARRRERVWTLRTRDGVSTQDLARMYGIDPRTIQKDLEFMRKKTEEAAVQADLRNVK